VQDAFRSFAMDRLGCRSVCQCLSVACQSKKLIPILFV